MSKPYEVKRLVLNDNDPDMEMDAAYSLDDGGYIGLPEDAKKYMKEYGITNFYKARPEHNTCSVGWCPSKQKWYGWSHRAIYGFTVGDVVKEGDCCAMSGWTEEYLAEHPEEDTSLPVGFEAKDLDDARKMAVAFAESVS